MLSSTPMTDNFSCFDTHAHLDDPVYDRDLPGLLERAAAKRVGVLTVGHDYASSKRGVEIAERYDNVWAAVGLHPRRLLAAGANETQDFDLEKFGELAWHPKVVAVGECGLDYREFPERPSPADIPAVEWFKSLQLKVLGRFLELAREERLPLVMHCRGGMAAHEDMCRTLESWDRATPGFDARGIMHAFDGSWKDARRYFSLNFLISVNGVTAVGGYASEVLRKAPLSQVAVESDCPELMGMGWVRRNEPAYLPSLIEAVAAMRGESSQEVARQTVENVLRTFPKITRDM